MRGIKSFLSSLDYFVLVYKLRNIHLKRPAYQWSISQVFDLRDRHMVKTNTKIQRDFMINAADISPPFVWIDLLVISLASVSLVLTWQYIYRIQYLYNLKKVQYSKPEYEKELLD